MMKSESRYYGSSYSKVRTPELYGGIVIPTSGPTDEDLWDVIKEACGKYKYLNHCTKSYEKIIKTTTGLSSAKALYEMAGQEVPLITENTYKHDYYVVVYYE